MSVLFEVRHSLPVRLLTLDHPLANLIRAVEGSIAATEASAVDFEMQVAIADALAVYYRRYAVAECPELLGIMPPPEVLLRRDGVIVHRAICAGLA